MVLMAAFRSNLSASKNVLMEAFPPGGCLQFQRYLSQSGKSVSAANDRHYIALILQRAAAPTERRGASGNWIRYLKEPGSLTIVPPGPMPDVRLLAQTATLTCALENNFIREIAQEMDRQPASDIPFQSGVHDDSIAGILNLIANDFEAEEGRSKLYSETLAHALAIRFLLFKHRPENLQVSAASPLPPKILRRIQDRINAELDTDLSLASLAKESGYSRSHFIRMFRSATGLTPHQYVLERRLCTAQHLLRQSRISLADIALGCGFSSQSYMTDIFRQQLGITPQQYRRSGSHKS